MPDPIIAAAAALAFLLAGFVKGVLGFGLPTLAMGLLGLVMAPAEAAALLIVPSLATNLMQLAGAGLGRLLRRTAALLAGICLGTWGAAAAGIGLLSPDLAGRATGLLGLALALYAAVAAAGPRRRLSSRAERWTAPLIGITTGAVAAATGIQVIPAAPWLQALGLDRDALVRAMGLSFTVSTAALALTLMGDGPLDAATAAVSAAALVPAATGMAAGAMLRRRIRPDAFRRGILASLAVLGLWLAWRWLV
ncbi:MAG: TSUP family transporter [Alphaproteobacteria bacterium]